MKFKEFLENKDFLKILYKNGFSYSIVSQWRSGKLSPSPKKVDEIQVIFGVVFEKDNAGRLL